MPIYSYRCGKCGKVFEKLQKVGENGKVYCEDCGEEAFRMFLPVGVIFKGSGFYTTDYNRPHANGPGAVSTKNSKEKEDSKKAESKSTADKAKSSSLVSKEKVKS